MRKDAERCRNCRILHTYTLKWLSKVTVHLSLHAMHPSLLPLLVAAWFWLLLFVVTALVLLDASGDQFVDHSGNQVEPEDVQHLQNNEQPGENVEPYPVAPPQVHRRLIKHAAEDEAGVYYDTRD